jgi:hypothetical protein
MLQAVADWAHLSRQSRVGAGALSLEEIAELSALAGTEIGADTMTHTGLAPLPVNRQREENVGSRRLLEEVTGATADSFSYQADALRPRRGLRLLRHRRPRRAQPHPRTTILNSRCLAACQMC